MGSSSIKKSGNTVMSSLESNLMRLFFIRKLVESINKSGNTHSRLLGVISRGFFL